MLDPGAESADKGLPYRVLQLCWVCALIMTMAGCSKEQKPGFVYMENGRMMVRSKPFFPLVMNYQVNLVTDGVTIWPVPYSGYNVGDRFRTTDPDSAAQQLRAELALLRSLGFNAVRVNNFTEGPLILEGANGPRLKLRTPAARDTFVDMYAPGLLDNYFAAVGRFLDLARQESMRVILLSTIHNERPGSLEHFTSMADHFRADTIILAFDLFNEPLYFDERRRSKEEVYGLVLSWRKMADRHAPDHLITIGLAGIREVHFWDPNLLDVDFLSFHPYEYEPDQVLNELYWYGQHVRTPWMIGETSLPADNDSVPYAAMTSFAQRTLAQTVACGGIGYSWWQFKDVNWGAFHSDRMGLVEMSGTIPGPPGALPVQGTLKPAAEVFRTFDPMRVAASCVQPANYHNYSEHDFSRITGKLVDQEGHPLEGGVVIAFNRDYTHSYHTTSRADGHFELKGDMHFHHWMASALEHSTLMEDLAPSAFMRDSLGVFSFHLGELQLDRIQRSAR